MLHHLISKQAVGQQKQSGTSVWDSRPGVTYWTGSFPAAHGSGGPTGTCGLLWTPRTPSCSSGGSIWPRPSSHRRPGCCRAEWSPDLLWTSAPKTRPERRTPAHQTQHQNRQTLPSIHQLQHSDSALTCTCVCFVHLWNKPKIPNVD